MKIVNFDDAEEVARVSRQIKEEIKYRTGFVLPSCVFPTDSDIDLYNGFCIEKAHSVDETNVVVATQSAGFFLNLFYDLLARMFRPQSHRARFYMKSTHDRDNSAENKEFIGSSRDFVILQSYLYDYEDILINDGCTSLSICSTSPEFEISLDEHKVVTFFSDDMRLINNVACYPAGREIPEVTGMKTVMQVPHIHESTAQLNERFENMVLRLGAQK